MPSPFLSAGELADLQRTANTALPEACTRVRAGATDLVTTCAVLPAGGDTELGNPPVSVGSLPRWQVRLPAGTDVQRGDALLSLSATYYVTDIWTPRTYTVFLSAQTVSLSPLPLATISWRKRLLPGQAGTTLCACWDAVGKRTTDPAHPTCFGTGVVGGYATAGTVLGYLSLVPDETQALPAGVLDSARPVLLVVPLASTGGATFTAAAQRGDLLIVSPDPLGTSGNPDRRYVLGDQQRPLTVFDTTIALLYEAWPVELGAIVYRVAPANTTLPPDTQYGTL